MSYSWWSKAMSWMIKLAAIGRRWGLMMVLAAATPAMAQDPVMRAQENYRRGVTQMVEQLLFSATQKTSKVIFLRNYRQGEKKLFCGEALFGSARQSFVIDMTSGGFMRAPTKAQWNGVGCEEAGYETLIDLR